MRIDVITLFPEVFEPYITASILGRAQSAGVVSIHTHQLREFSSDPHCKVDDRPFGGGPGMVLSCQPVVDAVEAIEALDERTALRVLLTPQGRSFTQREAKSLSAHDRLLLICGHYEGYDERIVDILQPVELSVGDFVLTGGEIPALAVIDAVTRLLPGALGNADAAGDESFENPALEHPHYTRPREFRGHAVPDVLISGDHAKIAAWRASESQRRTAERRPDLLDPSAFSPRSTLPNLQNENETIGIYR
ncbi:MAG: tRNA (guanosine(37)-N1)-methyltransferase TrmD [Phycisphaerales bacterium]|nr:tRNA (guanosine(37)-N1)-methyltransferase TrmD [Phycisphaerales bacterium]